MKMNIFNSFGRVSIIIILLTGKLACDTNGIHEQPTISLPHFFMKEAALAALNYRTALWGTSNTRRKEGALTTYIKLLNNLLETHDPYDLSSEVGAEILHFA